MTWFLDRETDEIVDAFWVPRSNGDGFFVIPDFTNGLGVVMMPPEFNKKYACVEGIPNINVRKQRVDEPDVNRAH